ncbi:MAG: hypothetical protein ACRYG5_09880 [Janthinobacterium lividum]
MNRQEFQEFERSLPPTIGTPVYIYALIDPETDLIRYIGKSVRPMDRLTNHMNERSNCHRSHWLQALKSKGLRPDLAILERIGGAWPWQHSETYWIAYARRHGWPLTNNTEGGDGVTGLPAETRARMAAVWTGRKHKPESIAKMLATKATNPHRMSLESKANMSRAHSGRVITWGDKLSAALRKIEPEQVLAIKARLYAGERTGDLAVEFGVHRTTISKIKMGTYHAKYRN